MKLRTVCCALAFPVMTAGCGASLHAVYEGDVRFERCMSLDLQPQLHATEVRECWEEWVAFYTYGQTRDRVLHAQLRIQQLSPGAGGARLDEPGAGPLTAPGPSNASAPPPMMAPGLGGDEVGDPQR